MKYITIKVKHILIFILIFILFFSSMHLLGPDLLYMMGKIYEKAGKQDVASAYYDKILQVNPKSPLAAFTTHRKFINILSSKDFRIMRDLVYITKGSAGKSGSNISSEDLNKINEQYEKVIHGPIDEDLKLKLHIDAALLNWFGGNPYKSVELLEEQIESKNKILKDLRKLYLCSMYLLMGEVEKIPSLVNENNIHTYSKPLNHKASSILAYYYLLKSDTDKFAQYAKEYNYNLYASLSSENKTYATLLDIEEASLDFGKMLSKQENDPFNKGIVDGTMRIKNKPFSYHPVMLIKYDDTSFSSCPWINEYVSIAITDKNGHFTFKNVPAGVYNLSTYVPWSLVKATNFRIYDEGSIDLRDNTRQQIHVSFEPIINIKKVTPKANKITFEFKKVKDAAYYTLEMGEVYNKNGREYTAYTFHSEPFTQTKTTLDIEKYRGKESGGLEWDDKGIIPDYVMGAFYHEGNYTYKITAYNKNEIIGDSFGIFSNEKYPTVFIPGNAYTKADQLLFNRSYEKAIAAYEEYLNKNPNDLHSLEVLSRLFTLGYKSCYLNEEKESGIDIKKAIYYTERLLKLKPHDEELLKKLTDLYGKVKEAQ